MSGADLISRFGDNHTFQRNTVPQTTLKGAPVPPVYEEMTMLASIQPMRPKEIIEENIGAERTSQAIKIYTATELKVDDTVQGLKADIVNYQGKQYEVRQVDPWLENQMNLTNYYKAIAFKVNKELT